MPQRRAFLVEDNPLIRDNLIPALQDLADVHVVEFAATEADALAWLDSHSEEVEVIILDMFLIKGSGLGVLQGIRSRGIQTTVIVLSNHATQDMRMRCARSGARAFFDKARENDEFFEYLNKYWSDGKREDECR